MIDWREWHERYDDPASWHAARLVAVQALLRRALPGAQRVLSICAGDGRDVLPLLERHVHVRLLETDPELSARAAARAADLPDAEILRADAGVTDSYAGVVPADVVLLCGVFGNVVDADVERTIRTLPQLCAEGGRVVWTRHRTSPDLTVSIRAWLAEVGFEELAFESPGPESWSAGLHVSTVPPQPLRTGVRLFSFFR